MVLEKRSLLFRSELSGKLLLKGKQVDLTFSYLFLEFVEYFLLESYVVY
jgi:hypothetical protein